MDTGLLQCTLDLPSCLDSLVCAPCQIGRQCSAIDNQINEGNVLYCVVAMLGCAQILTACIRCKVVQRYNLDENACVSAVIAYLCPVCSLAQTHRQLTLRGTWPGGVCVQQPYVNGNAPIS